MWQMAKVATIPGISSHHKVEPVFLTVESVLALQLVLIKNMARVILCQF